MVQYALGKDDTGPVEIQAVPIKSTDEQGQLWKGKTRLPQSARERRFWPVVMRYADGVEVRFVHGPDFIRFYGERGVMKMRRNHFETDPPDLVQHGPDASIAEKWKGGGHVARPHLENWLDAIRSGTALNAPVEGGHRTATICHLANLARELGRPLSWNPQRESFHGDDQAQAQLSFIGLLSTSTALPYLRVLWVAEDKQVFVGRTQDWTEKVNSTFRKFPRGMERVGAVIEKAKRIKCLGFGTVILCSNCHPACCASEVTTGTRRL